MRKKRLKFLFTTLVLALSLMSLPVHAQKVHAFAKPDTTAITIGDQIGLTLGIDVPENFNVQWPVLSDTLVPHIEIVNRGSIDSVRQNGLLKMQQRLIITSFDSGYFHIKPFLFHFKNGTGGQDFTANTQGSYIKVYSPKVDTTKAFKAIKGPVSVPYTFWEIFPWALLILVVIGGVIFLIWYLKKRKNHEPVFARKPKPLLPPHVEAVNRLEELRLSRMWQAGKLKAYHSALTDIMRNYFLRRFNFEALEMTSDEVMENLEENKVNDQVLQKIKEVFQLADLVKFAKVIPTAVENDISLNYCIDFVDETKVVPQDVDTKEDKKGEEGK